MSFKGILGTDIRAKLESILPQLKGKRFAVLKTALTRIAEHPLSIEEAVQRADSQRSLVQLFEECAQTKVAIPGVLFDLGFILAQYVSVSTGVEAARLALALVRFIRGNITFFDDRCTSDAILCCRSLALWSVAATSQAHVRDFSSATREEKQMLTSVEQTFYVSCGILIATAELATTLAVAARGCLQSVLIGVSSSGVSQDVITHLLCPLTKDISAMAMGHQATLTNPPLFPLPKSKQRPPGEQPPEKGLTPSGALAAGVVIIRHTDNVDTVVSLIETALAVIDILTTLPDKNTDSEARRRIALLPWPHRVALMESALTVITMGLAFHSSSLPGDVQQKVLSSLVFLINPRSSRPTFFKRPPEIDEFGAISGACVQGVTSPGICLATARHIALVALLPLAQAQFIGRMLRTEILPKLLTEVVLLLRSYSDAAGQVFDYDTLTQLQCGGTGGCCCTGSAHSDRPVPLPLIQHTHSGLTRPLTWSSCCLSPLVPCTDPCPSILQGDSVTRATDLFAAAPRINCPRASCSFTHAVGFVTISLHVLNTFTCSFPVTIMPSSRQVLTGLTLSDIQNGFMDEPRARAVYSALCPGDSEPESLQNLNAAERLLNGQIVPANEYELLPLVPSSGEPLTELVTDSGRASITVMLIPAVKTLVTEVLSHHTPPVTLDTAQLLIQTVRETAEALAETGLTNELNALIMAIAVAFQVAECTPTNPLGLPFGPSAVPSPETHVELARLLMEELALHTDAINSFTGPFTALCTAYRIAPRLAGEADDARRNLLAALIAANDDVWNAVCSALAQVISLEVSSQESTVTEDAPVGLQMALDIENLLLASPDCTERLHDFAVSLTTGISAWPECLCSSPTAALCMSLLSRFCSNAYCARPDNALLAFVLAPFAVTSQIDNTVPAIQNFIDTAAFKYFDAASWGLLLSALSRERDVGDAERAAREAWPLYRFTSSQFAGVIPLNQLPELVGSLASQALLLPPSLALEAVERIWMVLDKAIDGLDGEAEQHLPVFADSVLVDVAAIVDSNDTDLQVSAVGCVCEMTQKLCRCGYARGLTLPPLVGVIHRVAESAAERAAKGVTVDSLLTGLSSVFSRIASCVTALLEDGAVDADEQRALMDLLDALLSGLLTVRRGIPDSGQLIDSVITIATTILQSGAARRLLYEPCDNNGDLSSEDLVVRALLIPRDIALALGTDAFDHLSVLLLALTGIARDELSVPLKLLQLRASLQELTKLIGKRPISANGSVNARLPPRTAALEAHSAGLNQYLAHCTADHPVISTAICDCLCEMLQLARETPRAYGAISEVAGVYVALGAPIDSGLRVLNTLLQPFTYEPALTDQDRCSPVALTSQLLLRGPPPQAPSDLAVMAPWELDEQETADACVMLKEAGIEDPDVLSIARLILETEPTAEPLLFTSSRAPETRLTSLETSVCAAAASVCNGFTLEQLTADPSKVACVVLPLHNILVSWMSDCLTEHAILQPAAQAYATMARRLADMGHQDAALGHEISHALSASLRVLCTISPATQEQTIALTTVWTVASVYINEIEASSLSYIMHHLPLSVAILHPAEITDPHGRLRITAEQANFISQLLAFTQSTDCPIDLAPLKRSLLDGLTSVLCASPDLDILRILLDKQ